MQYLRYTITYNGGETEEANVYARNINSGFAKALKIALQPLGNGTRRGIHSIAFSLVLS